MARLGLFLHCWKELTALDNKVDLFQLVAQRHICLSDWFSPSCIKTLVNLILESITHSSDFDSNFCFR